MEEFRCNVGGKDFWVRELWIGEVYDKYMKITNEGRPIEYAKTDCLPTCKIYQN